MSVNLIIDTDISSDCDDCAALTVAMHAQDKGDVNVLCVTVTDPNWLSAAATSCVLTYFNRAGIPIGINKTPGAPDPGSVYTANLQANFPNSYPSSGTPITDAVVALRTALHNAADASVTIVTIGSLQNMANLLASSADGIDSRDGNDLILAKVIQTVVMGGQYPTSVSGSGGAGPEHNFALVIASTVSVVTGWPVPITFCGWEIGNAVQVGTFLAETPAANPTKEAYILHNGGSPAASGSWDLCAVDYAIYGNGHSFYNAPVQGTNSVNGSTGDNTFTAGAGTQYYLTLSVSDATVALYLNQIIMIAPGNLTVQSTWSLIFSGTEYGDCQTFSQIHFGTATNFTLSCWFKSSKTTGEAIMFRYGINSGDNGWGLEINSNKLEGLVRGDTGGLITPTSSGNVADGKWHHAAMTVARGGNTLVYLDGAQVASGTTPTGTLTSNGASDDLTIGNRGVGDSPLGDIDDISVFNSVLTPTQIANIANGSLNVATLSPVVLYRIEEGTGATTVLDLSGNGHNMNLQGGPAWSTSVPPPLDIVTVFYTPPVISQAVKRAAYF